MKENPKHIRISEYNYPLPDERIAKFPLPVRDQSKLLIYRHGEVSEDVFTSLPEYLPAGSLMIFNNTKVIQARLHFRKETGALIEVFCLEPIQPNDYVLNFQQTEHAAWLCMIGNLKKWKDGQLKREMTVKGFPITLTATRGECKGTSHWVDFAWDNPDEDLTGYFQRFLDLTAIKSSRQRRVYVLTNYGSTHEQDLYRVNTLRAMGFDPYVMIYERPTAPPVTRHLQRWVNNKRLFYAVPRFEDYIPGRKEV